MRAAADKIKSRGDQGTRTPRRQLKLSGKAADLWRDSYYWINIADPTEVVAARKGITGFNVEPTFLFTVADLRAG